MNNFAYRNSVPSVSQPSKTITWTNTTPITYDKINDERFGGAFLLPFLTGAIVSAPLWYIGGSNKAQQQYQQPIYYQNQYNPMYYPYTVQGQEYPSYYPYPMYR